MGETSKKRMMNLELLRCIAMMMVVVLHFLGKGELLPDLSLDNLNSTGVVAWILECFSIVAVNLYMMISGYLLCESDFKWSRLVKLLLQIWFYSVVFGVLGLVLGTAGESFSIYYLIRIVFPIFSEHYWFMTAYVFLYLLLPFVGIALQQMDKKQLGVVTLVFIGTFSVTKTILPVRLPLDQKGYDFMWYLTVFLVAAYVRKYGLSWLNTKRRGMLLYVGGCAAVFVGLLVYGTIYAKLGKLDTVLHIFTEYNHLFCLLAALGLFIVFLQIEVKGLLAKVAGICGPLTLGVYLLHENLGFRYAWPKWFGAEKIDNPGSLIGCTLLAVVVVFLTGILVEYMRKLVMKPVNGLIDKICK